MPEKRNQARCLQGLDIVGFAMWQQDLDFMHIGLCYLHNLTEKLRLYGHDITC